jgi:hypothetical protein
MKTLKNRTRLYGTYGLWRPALCFFKHTDIERTHIHIVSTCVDRYGKSYSDSYEKLRSMNAPCIGTKYQLPCN